MTAVLSLLLVTSVQTARVEPRVPHDNDVHFRPAPEDSDDRSTWLGAALVVCSAGALLWPDERD